jgi:hypothetical protein
MHAPQRTWRGFVTAPPQSGQVQSGRGVGDGGLLPWRRRCRSGLGRCLAGLHDDLGIAMAAGGERSGRRVPAVHGLAKNMGDVLGDWAEPDAGPLESGSIFQRGSVMRWPASRASFSSRAAGSTRHGRPHDGDGDCRARNERTHFLPSRSLAMLPRQAPNGLGRD